MVKKIERYDHPNYTVHRELAGQVEAAASSYVHFQFFQKVRLRAVHGIVLVAGTATATPADASLEVSLYGPAGTTSIANFAVLTNTAMHLFHATVTQTIAANNGLRFAKALGATMMAGVYCEYEVLPDALQS